MLKTLKEVAESIGQDTPSTAFLHLSLECERPWAGGMRAHLRGVDAISIGRGEERRMTRRQEGGFTVLRIDVPDERMSTDHARMELALGQWGIQDLRSSNGTLVNGQRVSQAALVDGSVLTLGRTMFVLRVHELPEADCTDCSASDVGKRLPGLRTFSPLLTRDFNTLLQVASSNIDILVLGETGTGKELIANAIHAASRRTGDVVAVNCGALTDSLLESQLFGYQKGAFSGATENKLGLIRSADKGTLFLDEVGDLPAGSQAAFLRVLQEREVTAVGATRPVSVDVRVVAATHQPLEHMVASQEFRSDLLARLRGFVIRLPPLRDRLEDLGTIIATILSANNMEQSTTFSLKAALLLFGYAWPSNIRELGKSLELAAVLARGKTVGLEHLPEYIQQAPGWQHIGERIGAAGSPVDAPAVVPGRSPEPGRSPAPARELSDEDMARREQIVAMLQEHGGNVSAVAREMNKARFQIQRWIKRFGIEASDYQ